MLSPVYILQYDYMLWGHMGVSDEVMYKAATTIYESEKDLKAASPLRRGFSPAMMTKNQETPSHPCALKYYEEIGLTD